MEAKDKKPLETQNESENPGVNPELENAKKVEESTNQTEEVAPVTESSEPQKEEVEDATVEENKENTEAEVPAEEAKAPVEATEDKAEDVEAEKTTADEVDPVAETEEKESEEVVEAEAPAEEINESEAKSEEEAPEVKEEAKPEEEVEKEEAIAEPEPEVDYSSMNEVELINAFKELLENEDFMKIYHQVEKIKVSFYKRNKARIQAEKKAYLAEGGNEDEFKAELNPYEPDMKKLLSQFRQLKTSHNKELEAEKEKNLKLKYEIIEEIKGLVNREESINKTFQEFKVLQQKWHDIGMVPQASLKDLWENYHHHVENFYDYIKINKELRDLDLKKNLEEKVKLCEKAEELLLEKSIVRAFNILQKLHDAWREVGPVPREQKEEIWERFKEITQQINRKHQDFFEERKKGQKKNLEAKTALCEQIEEILTLEFTNHQQWEEKSKEIVEMQKLWRTIGYTPKKDNNIIYERFRVACDQFFDNKREFYSKHKEQQANNMHMKIDLCVQAEALKDSTDWKATTDELIAIQKKWKEIGPISRKNSEMLWKRFRAACDHFFDKKSEFFNSKDESQVENLKLKKALIEEIEKFKPSGSDEETFEQLRDLQRKWSEIGYVPFSEKDKVQKRFRDAINKQFDKLRIEDKERNLLKFKTKMSDWKSSSRGQNKLYAERDKYVSKLKQLESDLITLQNNIGFFSNSKGAEALIKEVEQKIKNNEEQIEYLKEKIRVIDDVDYSEE